MIDHPGILVDPYGGEHYVDNVAAFIDDRYELFDDDEDVVKRPREDRPQMWWTRADRRLRQIMDGTAKEWKGWRLKTYAIKTSDSVGVTVPQVQPPMAHSVQRSDATTDAMSEPDLRRGVQHA
jgi:hypothetical protein